MSPIGDIGIDPLMLPISAIGIKRVKHNKLYTVFCENSDNEWTFMTTVFNIYSTVLENYSTVIDLRFIQSGIIIF